MKKLICMVLMLVVLVGFIPFSCAYAAAEDGFDEYDFMLLLDRSTSMQSSDPNDVSVEAAKMFIDACEFSGSRVSIVRFSLDCSISRFYTLNTISNRNAAKNEIDKMKTNPGSRVGTAMLKSVNSLLENGDPSRKKFIVLLSDGGLSESDVLNLQEACVVCQNNSIPVYVIGAQNSTWNYSDEAYLSDLAKETNGDFLLATSIEDVPDFFRGIFSKLRNTTVIEGPSWEGDGSYYVVPVDVKDTYMSYADVNVSSGKELEDVYIKDPDGNIVAFDDEHFIRSESRLYNYIRLVEPAKGTWNVYIKGATRDQIHVSYIVNYAVEVIPFVTSKHMTATDYGKVGARLVLRGNEPADRDFYEFMSTAYATVKCGDTSERVPLAYDEEEGCLTAEYIPSGIGRHTVDAFVMCEYFQRQNSEAKAAEFTVGNSAPMVIGDIGPISLDLADDANNTTTVFFERLFKDPNGDPLTYSVKGSKRALKIEEYPDSFAVTAESPCEGNVTVTATDPSGASADYSFRVSISDSTIMQKKIIAACIAAVVLVLIAIAILCTKRVRGYFTVAMEGAAPKGSVYFRLEDLRRNPTLKEVINFAKNRYLTQYSVSVNPGFEQMISDNREALEKITITGTVFFAPKKLVFRSRDKSDTVLINGTPVGKRTMTNNQYFNITIKDYDRYVISLYYTTGMKPASNNLGF